MREKEFSTFKDLPTFNNITTYGSRQSDHDYLSLANILTWIPASMV